ncbi:Uncharacterised protein [uncultured Clostridium sp.]|uniref:hypothetical protein n=1 Tax=uncultured Clostridium sp. TaxID=59620 RepID=UPI0008205AC6|nr:hypothetical protein [uncultured Clostridium sp.]SCJ54595.1 Uncharacterised protein [uncultured Clostridium sp.]
MNTVIIEKNKYIYKGKIYADKEVEGLIKKCGKNIKVVILAENPLIKICENIDLKNRKNVEINILSNLIIDDDTLVDYIIDKKFKKIYIYSIKQGVKVRKVLMRADKMLVEPIQYILISIIKKRFKLKGNYEALIQINNYLYLIHVQNGKLVFSKTIEGKEDEAFKLVQQDLVGKSMVVDINLKDIIINKVLDNEQLKNITYIDLKEKVDYEISKI